jgi:hypothetical protein
MTRVICQAEVDTARTIIQRTKRHFAIKPEQLAGDTAYGSGAADFLVLGANFS